MDIKTKIMIRNMITSDLYKGLSYDSIKDNFLAIRMAKDFGEEHFCGYPSLKDIFDNLIANDSIENTNISAVCRGGQIETPSLLNIKLSPMCSLHIYGLGITVNESCQMGIDLANTKDVVMWVIRQKQNLNLYLQEWEELFKESAKTIKGKRMAFLAIQAIFTEAMKDYPQLRYEIVEQKRRARIKVKIPNSNLGVCLDGWWGTYKEQLPKQIESLKALIEVHRNSAIRTYTIYR